MITSILALRSLIPQPVLLWTLISLFLQILSLVPKAAKYFDGRRWG